MKHWPLVLFLVACGGKGGDSDHYGGWKAADTKAALQGAWVGPSPKNLVNKAAFEISGDTVKIFDGEKEESYKLVLENPCQIGVKDAGGTTAYFGVVKKDGQLIWGGGDSGQRTGDRAIMCAGIGTWVVKGDKCYERSMSGRWEEPSKKCGFRTKLGKEHFFWTWMDKESDAPMDGDYLWEFKDDPAKKVADYAAAKAALPPK